MFSISGVEMLRKTVGKQRDCGIVYVPKAWIGQKVSVILE